MYVLNLRSKTIHKHPTLEQCNCDSAEEKKKIKTIYRPVSNVAAVFIPASYRPGKWKYCKHCFK